MVWCLWGEEVGMELIAILFFSLLACVFSFFAALIGQLRSCRKYTEYNPDFLVNCLTEIIDVID